MMSAEEKTNISFSVHKTIITSSTQNYPREMKYKITTMYNSIKIHRIPRDMIHDLTKTGILCIITERANQVLRIRNHKVLLEGPSESF